MKNLILFFLFIIGNFANAQFINGNITDDHGNPISSVSVLVKNQSTQLIEKFTTTKLNGQFQLDLSEVNDTIYLEVYKLGYEKEYQSIIKSDLKLENQINFILSKSNVQLKEVLIKSTKPFTIKDDTVNYNVNHYKSDLDKSIEDVLKKMPGITVEDNGTIKYKNKPIEKLLLDGDDLFGHQYTNGSKNISPDIIDQVQAIDNFEENPLLKNIKHTDQVALNLKLKKGMADVSFNFDLAGGIQDRIQAKGNELTVSNAIKNFTTISYNNTGLNETPFDYFSGNSDVALSKIQENLGENLVSEKTFNSDVGTQRANNNKYWYGNTNTIFKISKATTIRLNFTALKDRIQYESSNLTNYLFDENDLNFSELNEVIKRPTLYDLNVKLTWKNKTKSMIENDFVYRYNHTTIDNLYESNYRNNFQSRLYSKNNYLRNHFLYTEKINNKQSLQLYSQFSINEKPQEFTLSPGVDLLGLNQHITNTNQFSAFDKYFTSIGFNFYGRNSLGKYELNAIQSLVNNKLSSQIFQDNTIFENEYFNNMKYDIINSAIEGKYTFVLGKLTWINSLKFKNYWIKNKQDHLYHLVFNPNVNLIYRFDPQNSLSFNYTADEKLPQDNNFYENYILVNHRTLRNNTDTFKLQKFQKFSLDFSNQSAYHQFTWRINSNYYINQNNLFSDIVIENDLTKVSTFILNTKNETFDASTSLEKYYYPLRSNFRLRLGYNWMNYQNRVNNSDLRTNINESFNVNFFVKSSFNFPINFENNLTYLNNQNFTEGFDQRFKFSSLSNSAKVLIKPSKSLFFNITWDYFKPNLDSKSEYHFLDTYMFFKPKKDNYTLYLKGANLLNNKTFEMKNISDYYNNFSSYSLNQRYILLGINFRL